MGALDGTNALVTGGTAGIGLASARALAEAGAHVFLTGRNQPTIDAAVASIGQSATGIRSDVSDLTQLDAIVDAVTAHPYLGLGALAPDSVLVQSGFITTDEQAALKALGVVEGEVFAAGEVGDGLGDVVVEAVDGK